MPMELFFRKFEAQCPDEEALNDLIIIHGLFGMSDNWVSIGKQLSERRRVIIPDMRNHGKSPHSKEFSIEAMVEDVKRLCSRLDCVDPIILGHSMGGRVAMKYALSYPDQLYKLIVADMSLRPAELKPVHWSILEIMESTPLHSMSSLKEIENYLTDRVPSQRLLWFVLKNIERSKSGFSWKLNHLVLKESLQKALPDLAEADEVYEQPCLFLKGGDSDYILPQDHAHIHEHFPMAIIETIDNAGHWLHADQPQEFVHLIKAFL